MLIYWRYWCVYITYIYIHTRTYHKYQISNMYRYIIIYIYTNRFTGGYICLRKNHGHGCAKQRPSASSQAPQPAGRLALASTNSPRRRRCEGPEQMEGHMFIYYIYLFNIIFTEYTLYIYEYIMCCI